MERFYTILRHLDINRIKFIDQKGYAPNRAYINPNDFDVLAEKTTCKDVTILGMNVIKTHILQDNSCIIFNTKDFPEIKLSEEPQYNECEHNNIEYTFGKPMFCRDCRQEL